MIARVLRDRQRRGCFCSMAVGWVAIATPAVCAVILRSKEPAAYIKLATVSQHVQHQNRD